MEANIKVTQEAHIFGPDTYYTSTFEWQGSKYDTAFVSKIIVDRVILNTLPWPVKILGVSDFGRQYEVVRKDVGWHLWWIFITIWRKIKGRRYYRFKWRVIMTFEVWGLGYQPEAEVISWKNIGRKREKS